jgi:hypothetical protein
VYVTGLFPASTGKTGFTPASNQVALRVHPPVQYADNHDIASVLAIEQDVGLNRELEIALANFVASPTKSGISRDPDHGVANPADIAFRLIHAPTPVGEIPDVLDIRLGEWS